LDGTYSKLSETHSKLEILKERLENEQIRAESYKLLVETLQKEHIAIMSAVISPIKEEVKKSLVYITGSLHENLELNEDLLPTELSENWFDEGSSLKFDDSSSGLKEVLVFCVRLAVAKHLSERDSQCLVLDDPFVHVSQDRLNKIIELINEAIKDWNLQIVVFTHRQMELSGFKGNMVNIQSAKMGIIE